MFKIKTKDVKRAMKKTGLEICEGSFYKQKCIYNVGSPYGMNFKLNAACPIGQIYYGKTQAYDTDKAKDWAYENFGKVYTKGFIYGFDGHESSNDSYLKNLNKKYHQEYRDGFKNGRVLRRTLLLEETTSKGVN